jgi:hypothetical protein
MAKLLNYDRWFQKKYAVQLRKFNELKLRFQIHCDENDVYFLVKEESEASTSRILWAMLPLEGMSTEKLAAFSPKFFAALPSLHHDLRGDDPDSEFGAAHSLQKEKWGIHVDISYSQNKGNMVNQSFNKKWTPCEPFFYG